MMIYVLDMEEKLLEKEENIDFPHFLFSNQVSKCFPGQCR